jgi:alkanesulfonate monooxygenase SsuD/methylene tetrahydromethanopterin reductase-like flavin-dependent oxidoreductase (luciferase family)
VKFGLQVYSFTWPGGPEAIGPTLARAVRTADDVGFDSIWVMDHFWQIGPPGSELQPMLEGWTTLGYMAAHSQRARLGLMVGGVHYRNPGLWVKAGEKKTLRLVAQYADASNLFGGPAHVLPKYAILAEHCEAVGRDFTEIERTNLQGVSLSSQSAWDGAPESTNQIVERFGQLAEAGVQHVIISTGDAHDPAALELLGRDVLPQLRAVEAADPRLLASTGSAAR